MDPEDLENLSDFMPDNLCMLIVMLIILMTVQRVVPRARYPAFLVVDNLNVVRSVATVSWSQFCADFV